MPSQGTLIQKGKDFSFNEKPKQTKPHFSLSVSRALSLLQKGCYQPGPDSAALRERKKPNKTNKKSPLLLRSHSCNLYTAGRAEPGEPRRGWGSVWNKLTQHRARSSQHGQLPLSALCQSFSVEPVLPGAPGRTEGLREQSTCHVVARLCQAKGNKGC